jgi:hypothetical protein
VEFAECSHDAAAAARSRSPSAAIKTSREASPPRCASAIARLRLAAKKPPPAPQRRAECAAHRRVADVAAEPLGGLDVRQEIP